MRSQAYIREHYGRVDTFIPTKENFFLGKYGFDKEGGWYYSDDTVLTFAILNSIQEIWWIDIKDMRDKHIAGYESYPYGFWSNTLKAFKEIKKGIPVQDIVNPEWWGNGMMMKQFPLAAYFALHDIDPKQEEQTILDISKVSHGHPAALVSAIVHHEFLKKLLKSDSWTIDKSQVIKNLTDIALHQESLYKDRSGKKISEVLIAISKYIQDDGNLVITDEQIRAEFGGDGTPRGSGFITTTLWIVYSLFLRDTTIDSVWDAVNFGWDTDTYASIIGNMSGSLHGEQYDEKLIGQVQDIDTLKKQVNDFIYKLLW